MNYDHESTSYVRNNGCAYGSLANYTHQYSGNSLVGGPRPAQPSSREVVIVPSFGGPGYKAVSSRNGSCTGYKSIHSAYPSFPGKCQMYLSNLCNNSCN
jgi:hypothetical protein